MISSTSELKCPNWMMEKSVIAFCEQYMPSLHQNNFKKQSGSVNVVHIHTEMHWNCTTSQVVAHNF